MSDICPKCDGSVTQGMRIFQIAVGKYYIGFETPTYQDGFSVLYEYHIECFSSPLLNPQRQPYNCSFCGDALRSRDTVIYGVEGDKPWYGYKRPERRGHEMPIIAHQSCYENYYDLNEE